MIEVEHLTKRYRSAVAVDDLSFSVPRGRITGFLGPNGAGKTTTLRVLLGLALPTSGRATLAGRRYRELDAPLRTVGAVLEASNYHPARSGRNQLRVLAAAAGISRQRVDRVLTDVELTGAAKRRVGGYSLGMRQRLSVAAALLGEPELLVLDEPANGLDPEGIRWLRNFLRSFAEGGGTVFVSSHVLAEVSQLADEVVIIHRGKLVAHQSVAELTLQAAGATRVRSPRAEELLARLRAAGIEAEPTPAGPLAVHAPPERVGDLAAEAGIPLHELVAEAGSLEEAFLELTAEPRQ
ncbi:MAG: ATP-binding cassette domain-containing protein [Actinobacteria bacterium]|nr:MAG: ATP-binding cassette domain-containing protein [Actinomycetota bacterium]TML53769.1 MAG: ATP-binding cassette domain-containing protein [Actinomycetota bacterium]